MTDTSTSINPELDLLLEREIPVSPELVWAAWTSPEHLTQWFTPAPWSTVSAEVDLRPGGLFRTVMRSPEGDEFPSDGCFLEVVDQQRLVFTSALGPDYRPVSDPGLAFTAVISITPNGSGGTRYSALAMHADADSCKQHADMGFTEGWGAALDQLVALAKTL